MTKKKFIMWSTGTFHNYSLCLTETKNILIRRSDWIRVRWALEQQDVQHHHHLIATLDYSSGLIFIFWWEQCNSILHKFVHTKLRAIRCCIAFKAKQKKRLVVLARHVLYASVDVEKVRRVATWQFFILQGSHERDEITNPIRVIVIWLFYCTIASS